MNHPRILHLGCWLSLGPLLGGSAFAADWPQYRGVNTDGKTPELIATNWNPARPGFLVWTNGTLTNGFSSFAVSGGRAFTLMSKNPGGGLLEYCVGLDATTGTRIWERAIGTAPWDYTLTYNGGAGTSPYNQGDGPRTTPSVKDGRVFALSGYLNLVCLNATNGSVIWSNNLAAIYGASVPDWENGASPCLDGDLIFVSLNSSSDSRNLAAFRTTNGAAVWRSQADQATHATPVVANIHGVRQVIFAARTGLVSLNRDTGAFLWRYTYPWTSPATAIGSSPVVYSDLVYCTAAYTRGAAAARVLYSNNTWSTVHAYTNGSLNYMKGAAYESIWMTPVCHQGYIYTLSGGNGTFLSQALLCIELSTGTIKWSTNNFGKGGIIQVNTNLLALTEKGELVLFDPNPAAYKERARYQALRFSSSAPGKCWNNPAYSNGRIYARGTRGAVSLDVSVPPPPALRLLSPVPLSATQMRIQIGTTTGTPLAADRLAGIEIRTTNRPTGPAATWQKLTNPLVLGTNGTAVLTNTINPAGPGFYQALELQ